jgi:hypothetical protein
MKIIITLALAASLLAVVDNGGMLRINRYHPRPVVICTPILCTV